jgi:hypothetical protein
LEDDKSIKLTFIGLSNFLRAYYNPDPFLLNKFNEFEKSLKHEKLDVLQNFFANNKVKDEKKIKNYLYFKLLELELEKTFLNKFKTSFMIEIDQKSSSSVFLSLLLKNKKLATESGLLKPNHNINLLLRKKTKEFIELKSYYNKEMVEFLTNNKKPHKYAFMC